MDLLGIQADLNKTNKGLQLALDRISQLESQTVKDVTTILDGLKSFILPEVQAAKDSMDLLTTTVNASVTEITNCITEITKTVKRINGATFNLGPEQ